MTPGAASMPRIGIRLSIFDDQDNEMWHTAAWLPSEAAGDTHRELWDACSAAMWEAVGRLVQQYTLRTSILGHDADISAMQIDAASSAASATTVAK